MEIIKLSKSVKLVTGNKYVLIDYDLFYLYSSLFKDLTAEQLKDFDLTIENNNIKYKDLVKFKEWFENKSCNLRKELFKIEDPGSHYSYPESPLTRMQFIDSIYKFIRVVEVFDWLGINIMEAGFHNDYYDIRHLFNLISNSHKYGFSEFGEFWGEIRSFGAKTNLKKVLLMLVDGLQAVQYVEISNNSGEKVFICESIATRLSIQNAKIDASSDKINLYKKFVYEHHRCLNPDITLEVLLTVMEVDEAIHRKTSQVGRKYDSDIVKYIYFNGQNLIYDHTPYKNFINLISKKTSACINPDLTKFKFCDDIWTIYEFLLFVKLGLNKGQAL